MLLMVKLNQWISSLRGIIFFKFIDVLIILNLIFKETIFLIFLEIFCYLLLWQFLNSSYLLYNWFFKLCFLSVITNIHQWQVSTIIQRTSLIINWTFICISLLLLLEKYFIFLVFNISTSFIHFLNFLYLDYLWLLLITFYKNLSSVYLAFYLS